MSQRPALVVIAEDYQGKHLLAAGPYRSGARAEAVAAAVRRVLLGQEDGANVAILPLLDGPQTPAQAAQTVGQRAWGERWGAPGSTSGEDNRLSQSPSSRQKQPDQEEEL